MSAFVIVYYVFSSLAIVSNLRVIYQIFHYEFLTTEANRLLLYLHITSLILNIATIPSIYLGNNAICQMMSVFHYYGGLSNVCVVGLLTIIYHNLIFNQMTNNELIERYSVYFIFLFPLIVFLPFTTNAYEPNSGLFCTLDIHNEESQIWAFAVFYIWAVLAIIICGFAFGYIFYYALKYDPITGKRLFFSLGLYVVVSLFALFPRCISRIVLLVQSVDFNELEQFLSLIPIPIAAMINSFAFQYNLKDYLRYATHSASTADSRKIFFSLDIMNFRLSDLSFHSASMSGRPTSMGRPTSANRSRTSSAILNPLKPSKNTNSQQDSRPSSLKVSDP